MFNISEENKKFLMKLSQKMNLQDNRSTQYPLFQVRTKEKIYGEEGNCNEVERIDGTEGYMCDKCRKLYENDKELPGYCEDCDSDCFDWYDLKYTPVDDCGLFFTAEAAQKHIDENSYHYTKPIVYGVSAWRNPEIQRVFSIISSLTTNDGKPRDYYK